MKKEKRRTVKEMHKIENKTYLRSNENNLNQVEAFSTSTDQRIFKTDRWLPIMAQLMCLLGILDTNHMYLMYVWIKNSFLSTVYVK